MLVASEQFHAIARIAIAARCVLSGCYAMSESENLVLKILEKLQAVMSVMQADMATLKADMTTVKADMTTVKADLADVKSELAEFRSRTDLRLASVEYRLGNVEGLLVENLNHTRVIAQVVKQHGHRLDALEADKRPPPTP